MTPSSFPLHKKPDGADVEQSIEHIRHKGEVECGVNVVRMNTEIKRSEKGDVDDAGQALHEMEQRARSQKEKAENHQVITVGSQAEKRKQQARNGPVGKRPIPVCDV